MSKVNTGKISFINHKKNYAVIDYEAGGKLRNIKANLALSSNTSHNHQYRIGDTVQFTIQHPKGAKIALASELKFLYNNAFDNLFNKAKTENRFVGYIKKIDDDFFIKEAESYQFVPLPVSPWQVMPAEKDWDRPVQFYLENPGKKEKATAAFFDNEFIPAFKKAVKHYKGKSPVEAKIDKLTPYGVYVNLFGNDIVAKINPEEVIAAGYADVKPGDTIQVMITFLNPRKIIVEPINYSKG